MIKILIYSFCVVLILLAVVTIKRKDGRISRSVLVFFFQPFLGFLVSLKRFDSSATKFIFIAFATLWGYAQSFDYPPSDVYRIGAAFCQNPVLSFSEIIEAFVDGDAVDGYLMFANSFVHLFTENVKVFFALLGFVYGIVCYETLASLVKERQGEKCSQLSNLLFLAFATASLANLSMPRYWTAAWLSAFIFLKITQGEKKWAFLCVVVPFIHFSFVPVALGLAFIAVFDRMTKSVPEFLFGMVLVMFLVSFVLPESFIGKLIPEDMLNDSERLNSKMGYINGIDDGMVLKQVSAYREANGIVTKLFHILMKVGSFFCIWHFHLLRDDLKKEPKLWFSYVSVLVSAFIAYFMSIIPITGWRYVNVLWLFLYIFLYRYNDILHPQKFRNCILSLYAINVYTICFMFYVTYRTVDLMLFYAPLPFEIIHGIGFPPVFFV
ncbi:MAG: hypothetical protein MJZ91_10560 [Bacteroidales bacterium]|nr:hypothetical protein [Bacteroidales bacterium]